MKTKDQYTDFIKGKAIKAEKTLRETELILNNIDFYYQKYTKKNQSNKNFKPVTKVESKESDYNDDWL